MKCWVKIGACATLIGLLGTDVGLQTALWFGAPTHNSVPASQQTAKPESSKKPEATPDTNHTPLILYTPLIVGILTLVTIGYQTVIFRDQHKIMARQADLARRAMTIVDEPRLLVPQVAFHTLRSSVRKPSGNVVAEYKIKMLGKTPATLRASFEELLFCERLPGTPDRGAGWLHMHTVVDDGDSVDRGVSYGEVDDAVREAMRGDDPYKREWRFFLIGVWIYDDVFGEQHEYGFCFDAGIGGGYGMAHGGQAYNYRRIRNTTERI